MYICWHVSFLTTANGQSLRSFIFDRRWGLVPNKATLWRTYLSNSILFILVPQVLYWQAHCLPL